MKGYVYCLGRDTKDVEYFSRVHWDSSSPNYVLQTKEAAMEYIGSFPSFVRWATKEEWENYCSNRAMNRIKSAFEKQDVAFIFDWLSNNDNTFSIKAFESLSGLKLDKAWKRRKEQLKSYYGAKYDEWQAQIAAEKLAEEEKQKAIEEQAKEQDRIKAKELLQSFQNGGKLSNVSFRLVCSAYDIYLHPRTAGYIDRWLVDVSKNGYSYYGKHKGSQKLFDIIHQVLALTA